MRIVYVEDNLANVHLVKRVARMGKHEVINYIDGMDALNNFATDEPDLVLMDIQLAGELTGIEVVEKLRADGFTTPIIAVTAYAMIGDKERCMEAGCTGYLSKPIPVTDLVNLFQEYNVPEDPTPEEPVAETIKPIETTAKPEADVSATLETEAQADTPTKTDEPIADSVAITKPTRSKLSPSDATGEPTDSTPVEIDETQTAPQATNKDTLSAEGEDKLSEKKAITEVTVSEPEETHAAPAPQDDKQAKMQ